MLARHAQVPVLQALHLVQALQLAGLGPAEDAHPRGLPAAGLGGLGLVLRGQGLPRGRGGRQGRGRRGGGPGGGRGGLGDGGEAAGGRGRGREDVGGRGLLGVGAKGVEVDLLLLVWKGAR